MFTMHPLPDALAPQPTGGSATADTSAASNGAVGSEMAGLGEGVGLLCVGSVRAAGGVALGDTEQAAAEEAQKSKLLPHLDEQLRQAQEEFAQIHSEATQILPNLVDPLRIRAHVQQVTTRPSWIPVLWIPLLCYGSPCYDSTCLWVHSAAIWPHLTNRDQ